jgi:hypothetical protein
VDHPVVERVTKSVMKICARSQQVSKTVQVSFKCLLNAQEMDCSVYAPNRNFVLCKVVQEGQFDSSEYIPELIVCRLPAGKPRILLYFSRHWAPYQHVHIGLH